MNSERERERILVLPSHFNVLTHISVNLHMKLDQVMHQEKSCVLPSHSNMSTLRTCTMRAERGKKNLPQNGRGGGVFFSFTKHVYFGSNLYSILMPLLVLCHAMSCPVPPYLGRYYTAYWYSSWCSYYVLHTSIYLAWWTNLLLISYRMSKRPGYMHFFSASYGNNAVGNKRGVSGGYWGNGQWAMGTVYSGIFIYMIPYFFANQVWLSILINYIDKVDRAPLSPPVAFVWVLYLCALVWGICGCGLVWKGVDRW